MAEKINTPIGGLEWITITGAGKTNLNGKQIFTADIVLDATQGAKLAADYAAYWEANKPKGAKEPKSMGYKVQEDGSYRFTFKTGTQLPSGDLKKIRTFDAKAAEVDLQGKQIGNGSLGRIAGAIDVYDAGPAARGVTGYLDAIQITELKEYKGAADAFTPTEGSFDGFDAQLN